MDESLFQRIRVHDVATWLAVVAVAAPLLGLAGGLALGARRRCAVRGGIIGLVGGLGGVLLLLGWHVVAARTSFHDRLYAREGGRGPGLWSLFPPASYHEGRDAARYDPRDPMYRGEPHARRHSARVRKWWGLVPADRLDSAGNLVLLAVAFALGGLGVGLAWGWVLWRWRPVAGERGAEP